MKGKNKIDTKKIKKILEGWENKLKVYFEDKAPTLPSGFSKFIVKILPYLVLISIIGGIISIISSFGIALRFLPLHGYRYGWHFSFWNIFDVIIIAINIMALSGLFKKLKTSWNLLFYSSLVQGLSYLVSFSLGSLIIGMVISWYFLFQIRKYYK